MARYSKYSIAFALLLGVGLQTSGTQASDMQTSDIQTSDIQTSERRTLHREGMEWSQWQVVGEAQLSWLFFDIYRSQLLAPDGRYRQDDDVTPHPIALKITYQRSISRQQLLDATLDQWQEMGFDKETRHRWIATLYDIFPDVDEDHQLIYVTDGSTGTFYSLVPKQPMKAVGHIEDEMLNDGFLSIWLGRNSQFPDLRSQLIGMNR
ncbi:chalcone isomerase family protein [Vibrio hippocampi]|uniref:Chalcone isomerase domain-containing protein n=1 Tax=Vibrio hippocampi TaxID=654686 RepID=A0ABM8ZJX5_9VIBR|nr:chalcone isomerase family protein [Vibrio hippocampi]CAH0526483.1 hypothetical protein VHP8226_01837 [Vibrio hippocampi]